MPSKKDDVLVGEDYRNDEYLGDPVYTDTSYSDGPVGLMLSNEYLSCFKLGKFLINSMAGMVGTSNIPTFVLITLDDFNRHFKKNYDPASRENMTLIPGEE